MASFCDDMASSADSSIAARMLDCRWRRHSTSIFPPVAILLFAVGMEPSSTPTMELAEVAPVWVNP